MGEVISEEHYDRFLEISRQMSSVLRKDIIRDNGKSGLKKKTLDLITKLRLERNII